MTAKSKAYLKARFETGDEPTQQDFTDLIDSYPNKVDEPTFTKSESDARYELKGGGPKTPPGVSFKVAPGDPDLSIDGQVSETDSVLLVSGEEIAIDPETLYYDNAQSGKERQDAVVVDSEAEPIHYRIITGPEFTEGGNVASAVIPSGCLLVHYLKVTDGGAAVVTGDVLTVNNQQPDAKGNVNVTARTTKDIQVVGITPFGALALNQVIPAGSDLDKIVETFVSKAVAYSYQAPSASAAINPSQTVYELGVKIPSLTTTVSFVQRDAGAMSGVTIKQDGSALILDVSGLSATVADIVTTIAGTIFDALVSYNAGPVKNGTTGIPTPGNIPAGSVTTGAITVRGILPYFFGLSGSNVLTGADIYAASKVVAEFGDSITIPTFGAGNGYLWFAVKSGSKAFANWYRSELNKGAIGTSSDLFGSAITVSVTSTGLFANWTEDFDLYISNYQTGGSAAMTVS